MQGTAIDAIYTTANLNITGLDCPDCAAKVEKAVRKMPGVVQTSLAFPGGKMMVEYDPEAAELKQIINKINVLGYGAAEFAEAMVIRLSGLDCADCAAKLEKSIQRLPGVDSARVNFGASRLEVAYSGPAEDVISVIEKMGYSGTLSQGMPSTTRTSFWKTNKSALTTLYSGAIILLAFILGQAGLAQGAVHIMYVAAVLIGGYLPARSGLMMLINAREIDMNILMIIAVTGAIIIGQFEEAGMVVFLFALGNALQAYTLDKTRRAITSLMELTPPEALVRRHGSELVLPVAEVRIGDIVLVKPGERIPMDGEVVFGVSAVDQSAITGESIPVSKKIGDEVYAGTINQRGAIDIEVTRLSQDNTIARLVTLVEEAQGQRAQSQQFVDRFARYYTPAVIGGALLVAIIPPLLLNQAWHKWVYEALAMLLVACPCALVISTPVSIVSAIGNAARQGILFKGGVYLEQMADLAVIAFDKTGTLTQGKPEVTDVVAAALKEEEVIALAASIETRSEHPLGHAIVQYARHQDVLIPALDEFESVTGLGARGKIAGQEYHIGNLAYLQELGLPLQPIINQVERLQNEGKTVMLLANASEVLGLIAVADVIRPASRQAIADLKKAGLKMIMLTGDNKTTAQAIARQAGLDYFRAELLPEDKVKVIKDLLQKEGKAAMVGDGVNDAPAMAVATVGIAMGAAGTDTALETADVALMADDLSRLPYTVNLSRRTVRIIKQNIAAALIIKALILSLVFPGLLTMWLAVIGDMGASLLVTLNGLRLARFNAESADSN